MVSLPGDSASSERVVSTPYATASNAQITATSAPWSDRKLDKGTPLDSDKSRNGSPGRAAVERGESTARSGLLPRHPQAPGRLGRSRAAFGRLFLLRLRAPGFRPPGVRPLPA